MEQNAENKTVKFEGPAANQQSQGRETPYLDLSMLRGTKDTARASLFIAIIGIIAVIALFAYGRKVMIDVNTEMAAITTDVNGRLDSMDTRLSEYEGLPEQVRRQALLSAIGELSARMQFLSDQVEGTDNQDRIAQIQSLLKELETGVNQTE